jgi:hypothetical protein
MKVSLLRKKELSQYSDWAVGWTSRVRFPADAILLFATASRPALGPTHPPMKWVTELKLPGREANHSPPLRIEVKKAWRYTSTLPVRHHGVVLS